NSVSRIIYMSEIAIKTPLQYLDQAMGKLRDLGLVQDKQEEAPIVGLLEKIADIEPEKIAIITRTLQQMSIFNEVVRDQVAEMSIGTRYEKITEAFDSIRDDAKTMVDQIEDGKLRSEEHTSELQSRENLVCRLLLE